MFSEPNFGVGLIGKLLCRIGSSAVPFLLPLLMQLQLGYTPLHSGPMMLPAAFAGTVAKGWISPLVKRYGYDNFLLWSTILVVASIVGFALFSVSTPLVIEIAILAVFGACNSMQLAAMDSVTLKGLSIKDAGRGNSLFSMVQMLAIGLGGIHWRRPFSASLGSAALAFRIAFVCVELVTLVSAIVFRFLDAVFPRPAPQTVTS